MKREALNKFNAPEMLAALIKALEVAGLDDTVKELKQKGFFRLVNDAWMHREKSASVVVQRWIEAAGMSVPEFSALVDKIGWGTKTTDYNAIEKAIMLKYSPQEAAALSDIRGKLHHDLYIKLDRWGDAEDVEWGTGDDGFGDLINHIIGLGKREYDAVMKDPKRAWERAQKDKYSESFSYAFPSRSDYASLNIKHYTRWANKLIHAFQQYIIGNRALKSMHRDALTIVSALNLMASGQVDAFLNTEKPVLTLFKKMKRNYEAKLKAMGGVPGRGNWDEDDDNPLTSGAWLENLYHDVRRFAEKTPIKLAARVAARWEKTAGPSVALKIPALVLSWEDETTEHEIRLVEMGRGGVLVSGVPGFTSQLPFAKFERVAKARYVKLRDRARWMNPQEVLAEAQKHVGKMCEYYLK